MKASKNDLNSYLLRLDKIHNKAKQDYSLMRILKQTYYQKYLIKEIPISYIENQLAIAKSLGYGNFIINQKIIDNTTQTIVYDQQKSLDAWIDYFLSDDCIAYPTWFKYWAFQGIVKIGNYDKNKQCFTKRSKNTVAPFIDVDRELLAMCYDFIKNSPEGWENVSFKKIYEKKFNEKSLNKTIYKTTKGIWKHYQKGDDHLALVASLRNKNTGWCTASELIAKTQLAIGDLYIYYSYNQENQPTEPRVAIRTEKNNIVEIRGINKNQNIEPEMNHVVETKLKEFPDASAYYKKSNDMALLTEIQSKHQRNESLSKSDLIFLYQFEDKIEGFGYNDDPRILEIKRQRDLKKDLTIIFDCDISQITDKIYDIHNSNIIGYFGNINSEQTKLSNISFPKYVHEDIVLRNVETLDNVTFPIYLSGSLDLRVLTSLDNVTLPRYVRGTLYLGNVTSARNTVWPMMIDGNLHLDSLVDAHNQVFPNYVGGSVRFPTTVKLENSILPKRIIGKLLKNNNFKMIEINRTINYASDLKLSGTPTPTPAFSESTMSSMKHEFGIDKTFYRSPGFARMLKKNSDFVVKERQLKYLTPTG